MVRYIALGVAILFLAGAHALLSARGADAQNAPVLKTPKSSPVVLLSGAERDLASRMMMLYVLYHPATEQIQQTDYIRLTASLASVAEADPRNLQPYYHVAYYWNWVEDKGAKALLAEFQQRGVQQFPSDTDIPFSVWRLLGSIDKESSIEGLKTASLRAVAKGGPKWMIDMPAILMEKEGESVAALLWIRQALEKTENPEFQQILLEKGDEISNNLQKAQ